MYGKGVLSLGTSIVVGAKLSGGIHGFLLLEASLECATQGSRFFARKWLERNSIGMNHKGLAFLIFISVLC